ncbi:hypothetical protein H6F76_16425 [Leptolyngbya sp. FACHB-321]|uniref:LIC_10190 family membrane protein n=1 Tax=Leptolyngbya sp. FACHB-321 TaxID=2692807 RepID=UPI0016856D86|nr:hypothetical protein [Leptolyngbya sp. FACHB-321]MBD2036598.1 hypothetical protein [Leptolyngbya sp. FACHB-321]
MAYFLISWNSLLITVAVIGLYNLKLFKPSSLQPLQQIILALWLGLVLQCLACLTIGLFIPVGPILVVLLGIGLTALIGLIITDSRKQTSSSASAVVSVVKTIGLPLLLCELAWSIVLSKPIGWFDTGLYHLGAIKWLAHYGFVPGLALVNEKFGFISSWFAFSAPLIPNFLGNHIGAVSNGFLLVLSSCTCLLIYAYRRQGKGLSFEETFLAIFLTSLIVFYLASWMANEPALLSFSNDLPVNFMTGIFAWSLLICSKQEQVPNDRAFSLDLTILPLVLSLSILSLKLTGLFLVPIAFLFYVSRNWHWRRWLIGSGMSLLLILPLASAQLITSGCFLYPAQAFCVELPWRVPSQLIASELKPIVAGGFFSFLTESLIQNPKVMAGALLITIVFGLLIWRVFQKADKPRGEMWIFATAILGSLYIFLVNKYVIFRFGGGVLLLIPTYFIATFLYEHWLNRPAKSRSLLLFARVNDRGREKLDIPQSHFDASGCQSQLDEKSHPHSSGFSTDRFDRSLTLILLGFLATLIAINLDVVVSNGLVPPTLLQPSLIAAKTNDVIYAYPADWTVKCWNAGLPCAPTPRQNLRFRNATVGLRGGFELSSARLPNL